MQHLTVLEALSRLTKDHASHGHPTISQLFVEDPRRFADFHVVLDDLLFDFSKHRLTRSTLAHLVALAQAASLPARRAALFAGERVNNTEQRPALHMALRDFSGLPKWVDGHDIMPDIAAERAKAYDFARQIRSGQTRGATGAAFTDIVNIGIGGSDLGPAMAVRALRPFCQQGLRSHFVSNVDGADIADTLQDLDPARTLFIIASKTFTTQETMTNAATARAWIVAGLGEAAVGAHFAAVSTRLDKVAAFGINAARVFGFWDWVGGRYSLWSSIGLPIILAIGPENFDAFLRGANAIDRHFQEAPLERNIPVLMALIGVYYRNICQFPTQAIIPYDQRLARFPAYLQQLDMESNGKHVTRGGQPVQVATGPIVWGEPGTNGQHAFFQLLHQGTDIVPVDFLVAARPLAGDAHHHNLLFANCLAQSEALMRGRNQPEAERQLRAAGMSETAAAELAPHKVFEGNRPSSTFLYQSLTPDMLGRLIALYEHKVFVQSVIWDINPFDQWGVELGKELASTLAPIVADNKAPLDGLNGSTAGLLDWWRAQG
ncbi:MAG: glucose-6-phosphate isomerase [Hyphomicrobiales bacterium]|nr:glucose-6-phosphate isomerase [Hyphomicrobiales bacterium]MDE2115307.1 glucose-6-phosphate isomerase [Hyphomicrobiales bacterium]